MFLVCVFLMWIWLQFSNGDKFVFGAVSESGGSGQMEVQLIYLDNSKVEMGIVSNV